MVRVQVLAIACAMVAVGSDAQRLRGATADAGNSSDQPRHLAEGNRSLYIFGYGSLLNQASRIRTACDIGSISEAELEFFERNVVLRREVRKCIDDVKKREMTLVKAKGVRRGWYISGTPQHEHFGASYPPIRMINQALDVVPTYLGAVRDPNSTTYAVIYPVTEQELAATDEREQGYTAAWLDLDQLEILGSGLQLPSDAQVRWYSMDEQAVEEPSSVKPICQSYVDVFVSGALQLEADNQADGFAVNVIASTWAWSQFWENDRIQPYRPFVKNSWAPRVTRTLLSAALVEGSHLKKSHLELILFPRTTW